MNIEFRDAKIADQFNCQKSLPTEMNHDFFSNEYDFLTSRCDSPAVDVNLLATVCVAEDVEGWEVSAAGKKITQPLQSCRFWYEVIKASFQAMLYSILF